MSLSKAKNIIEGWCKHLLNHYGLTEAPDFAKQRLEECNKCDKRTTNPFNEEDKQKNFCGKCGCLIQAKVLVKNEFCPVFKWGSINGNSKHN